MGESAKILSPEKRGASAGYYCGLCHGSYGRSGADPADAGDI